MRKTTMAMPLCLGLAATGCTAGGVTRNGNAEGGDRIQYFSCSQGATGATSVGSIGSTSTDGWGAGTFAFNPYSPGSLGLNSALEVPAGTNLVSVVDGTGNVYVATVDHVYDKQCEVMYDGSQQLEPCSKEIFEVNGASLGWQTGYSASYDAPIYPMHSWAAQASSGGPPVIGNSGAPSPVQAFLADPSCKGVVNEQEMVDTIASLAAWSQIGIPRPAWVAASADRRLRLMGALPSIDASVQSVSGDYLLGGAGGNKGPGLSVGLVLDDGLFFSDGIGYANFAANKVADETTVYGVGSLTKVFTGTSLLAMMSNPSLVKAGATAPSSLGQPASTWLPVDAAYSNAGATLANLVSHTGSYPNEMHLDGNPFLDEAQWLSVLQAQAPQFAAGSFGAYAGDGVEGVGLIIGTLAAERAQNAGALPNERSYELFVKNHLLTPLGMTSSGMGLPNVPASQVAVNYTANWQVTPPLNWVAPNFVQAPAYVDPEMLMPAGGSGGLYTNVADLSKFLKMWLSRTAPTDPTTGSPIVASQYLQSSQNALMPHSVGSPPAGCGATNSLVKNGHTMDAYYSGCGDAAGFGVNWYVGNSPSTPCAPGVQCNYLDHNGSTGVWGSNTRVSIASKMAATALISTDPYPNPAGGLPSYMPGRFMDSVVYGMLDSGTAADTATTSWAGSELGTAMARLLWLTGAPTGNAAAFDAQFTPQFLSGLGSQSIAAFVSTLQTAGACSTFRVRGITSNTAWVRMKCGNQAYDINFTSEITAPYRIAAVYAHGVSTAPY